MTVTITEDDIKRDKHFLDKVLKMARSPGDRIVLSPGLVTYTRGSWAFPEFGWIGLASGVDLLGSGSQVVLSPEAIKETNGKVRPSKDINVLWAGVDTEVTNVRFDCNGASHPGWNCGGLRFHGKFAVRGCDITGLSGTLDQQEVFAISAQGETGGSNVASVRVFDCLVDRPASYISGIYIGASEPGEDNLVSDCDVNLGANGWFAYSSTNRTLFHRCAGRAQRWWHTDTGNGAADIRECSGETTYAVISSVCTGGNPDRRIRVYDSKFNGGDGRFVEWWDKDGSQDGFVLFQNCGLSARYDVASDAKRGALVFTGCKLEHRQSHFVPGSPQPIYA